MLDSKPESFLVSLEFLLPFLLWVTGCLVCPDSVSFYPKSGEIEPKVIRLESFTWTWVWSGVANTLSISNGFLMSKTYSYSVWIPEWVFLYRWSWLKSSGVAGFAGKGTVVFPFIAVLFMNPIAWFATPRKLVIVSKWPFQCLSSTPSSTSFFLSSPFSF